MKDFPRDKASETAGFRNAQVYTAGGGADVAVTHLHVDKKIALSLVSDFKPECFEEHLEMWSVLHSGKCTLQDL